MSKYARRTDNNHSEFTKFFVGCNVPYQDTHDHPGMLDFLVQTRSGRLIRLEIKSGPAEKLTAAEETTFARFPGVCFKVWTTDQAQALIFDER